MKKIKLAALYQRGKAAYNIICRADETNATSVPNSTPLSSSQQQQQHRSRQGSLSKMTPAMLHRKKPSVDTATNSSNSSSGTAMLIGD